MITIIPQSYLSNPSWSPNDQGVNSPLVDDALPGDVVSFFRDWHRNEPWSLAFGGDKNRAGVGRKGEGFGLGEAVGTENFRGFGEGLGP